MITGGQYDVDVELMSPMKEIIYKQIKSQFDSHQFTAPVSQTNPADNPGFLLTSNVLILGIWRLCRLLQQRVLHILPQAHLHGLQPI